MNTYWNTDKKMTKLFQLSLVLTFVILGKGLKLCCEGENDIISSKNCSDGKPLDISPCKKLVMEANETHFDVDGNNNLVVDYSESVSPEKYCYGKMSNRKYTKKEVYIICIPEAALEDNSTTRIIILVFQFVSVIFFVLTIVTYLILPQMMDLQGICTIHSILGLLIGYIVLISENISVSYDIIKCHAVAYFLYFGFLYSFFWLNVCCFNIWKTVINPKKLHSIKNWKLVYHIYGIGFPVILLAFLVTVHHWNPPFLKSIHPGLTQGRCWFKSMRETLIYFYAPISILLLMNIGLFIWTGCVLWNSRSVSTHASVLKYRTRLYVSLFVVMGIQWVFEVISAAVDYLNKSRFWLWFITDSINALIGVTIFIVLVVLRKKVVRGLANKPFLRQFISFPTSWRNIQDSEGADVAEEETINVDALLSS